MILDLIVILVVALFTFIGYKQGLIKVAIKIASFFIAIIIALILFKPVSTLIINNTTIDDKIENAIESKMYKVPEGRPFKETVVTYPAYMPKALIELYYSEGSAFAKTLTTKLIELCTILILYIVARIVLKFIAALATLIEKIPILKQFNKLGGTVYGFAKGILIVYVILAIMYLASPLLKWDTAEKIEETSLTKMMYNNNIITKIML